MKENTTKTKAELFRMLAEAVRNTQPQPAADAPPEPIRDAQPKLKRKMDRVQKRTVKTKSARASASRKQRR
jgi:hypothetical protein